MNDWERIIEVSPAQIADWVNRRLPNGWSVEGVTEHLAGSYLALDGPRTVRDFNDVAYALDADMTLAGHGEDLIVLVMVQVPELGHEVIVIRSEFPDALREAAHG